MAGKRKGQAQSRAGNRKEATSRGTSKSYIGQVEQVNQPTGITRTRRRDGFDSERYQAKVAEFQRRGSMAKPIDDTPQSRQRRLMRAAESTNMGTKAGRVRKYTGMKAPTFANPKNRKTPWGKL